MSSPRKYENIDPEERDKILNAVKDVFNETNNLFNKIFDYCEPLGIVYDSSNRILAFNLLFSKAIKTYFAIYNMCESGHGNEAFIMFRSLMEIKINMKYLWNSDEITGDRFIEYEDFLRYDYLMDMKKYPEDYNVFTKAAGDIEKLKEKHDAFLTKHSKPHKKHYWSGFSIKQMIERLPDNIRKTEMDDYERIYRMCSFNVHSNVMALKKSISSKGTFRMVPNIDDIETVFPMATLYILQIIDYWLVCMEVPFNEDLKEEYAKLLPYIANRFNR